jgi:phage gp16-like protein
MPVAKPTASSRVCRLILSHWKPLDFTLPISNLHLKVARAWAAKELFSKFWEYQEEGWARRFFKDWFGWVSRSRLKPLVEVGQMLITAHLCPKPVKQSEVSSSSN